MNLIEKINWKNTLFLTLTPVIGIAGLIFLIDSHRVFIPTLLLALFWLLASGLSITGGYHRFFSHQTYQAGRLIQLFFLFFGAAAFQGSVLEWSTDHRNHHRYSETDKDPYNIEKGFWFAHIGWLMVLDTSKRDFKNIDDLMQSRWNLWQHKYYSRIAVFSGFIAPALIAACWGDFLGGLLIAGVLRTVLNHHFTFCINSVCHLFGQRRYSLEQTARDNWFTAFFTYGEGFHNFHHQFPLDYRNGIRHYHYDPTKWFIWALKQLRLAKDLKKISKSHLTRYRLRTDEQVLLNTFKQKSDELMVYINNYLVPLRTQILQVITQIEAIESQGKIKEYRNQLKSAHSELKYSLWVWSRLIRVKF